MLLLIFSEPLICNLRLVFNNNTHDAEFQGDKTVMLTCLCVRAS